MLKTLKYKVQPLKIRNRHYLTTALKASVIKWRGVVQLVCITTHHNGYQCNEVYMFRSGSKVLCYGELGHIRAAVLRQRFSEQSCIDTIHSLLINEVLIDLPSPTFLTQIKTNMHYLLKPR